MILVTSFITDGSFLIYCATANLADGATFFKWKFQLNLGHSLVLVIFLLSEILEIHLQRKWLIVAAVGAEGLATAIFFIWTKAALNFAHKK